MIDETKLTLTSAYDAGREQGVLRPEVTDIPNGRVGMLVPNTHELQIIRDDVYELPLKRIDQRVSLHDRDSFIAYVNRYKSTKTRIFAEAGFLRSDGKARVIAVFDYHLNSDEPQRWKHVATYSPRYSDTWERWETLCENPIKQAELAEIIEENRVDIVDPSAASLLDIIKTFKASRKVEFNSLTYQPDGGVILNYSEQANASGQSTVMPEKIQVGMPVYFRGTKYAVDVWVRYRVGGGGVTFQLKRDRPDVIEDEAFDELTVAITTGTEIEVYSGLIEGSST